MPVDANHRKIQRDEIKLFSVVFKSFMKQQKFLKENREKLFTKYQYDVNVAYWYLQTGFTLYPQKNREVEYWEEPLEWFRREMWLYEMIEDASRPIEKATEKWYKRRFRLLYPTLEKVWILYDPVIYSQYAKQRGILNLSNYKGAITHTTKRKVIETIKKGIDDNLTVAEMWKEIEKIDSVLFSTARAKTIAVTEIWKAYEYWNFQPVDQLRKQVPWIKMKKLRLTCRDAKVRPEHREAEEEGRVDVDHIYSSTGTQTAPWWVNCRCTMEYDFDLDSAINNLYI